MKVAVMHLSGMERRAFQKHAIFSNLIYRSGRETIKQNRPQALAASIQTLGHGYALARSAVSALAGRS
jgi:hypothetical protein